MCTNIKIMFLHVSLKIATTEILSIWTFEPIIPYIIRIPFKAYASVIDSSCSNFELTGPRLRLLV